MRADFFLSDAPDQVVGSGEWDGRRVLVRADDEDLRTTLERIFRVSSVATSDPATRPAGARADAIVEPGDLEWFRAAAAVRGKEEGLSVRLVTASPGGWDPAGSYVPMGLWVGRREGDQGSGHSLGTSRA